MILCNLIQSCKRKRQSLKKKKFVILLLVILHLSFFFSGNIYNMKQVIYADNNC